MPPLVLFHAHLANLGNAVEPLHLANVRLKDDWQDALRRDAQYLNNLQIESLFCHFTTTANLSRCESSANQQRQRRWITHLATNRTYTHHAGFLDARNDAAPPMLARTPSACQSRCSAVPLCAGYSFEPSATTPIRCFFKTAAARLVRPRKTNCVAGGGPPSAPVCSPLPGEMGLGGYFGHFQGHWLSATAFLINATADATARARADEAVALLERVARAWESRYGPDRGGGYLFPYDPVVWDMLLSGRSGGSRPLYSVPFYTLHKLMAGLLDLWTHAASERALGLVKAVASWVRRRVDETITAGGEERWQRVLLTEWGGMNDVLYHLYEATGDERHLATGRLFNAYIFTAPLAASHDDLATQPFPHANFHLPEMVGNARAAELTANATDAAIVDTFFSALTSNHSFATGGSSSGECWQAPRDLGRFLTDQTEESCTQYNVLKVARRRFLRKADASDADFYERALWNGILGNQRRVDPTGVTSYIYMLPLGSAGSGVVRKAWGRSDYGFPCCWGTLSESFAKLGDSIFFRARDERAMYVNQWVSADARWPELGLTLEQRADFPAHPTRTSTITVRARAGATVEFTLRVRVPGWLKAGSGSVRVNGVALADALVPTSFVSIRRAWRSGDVVDVSYPPTLWTNPLDDARAEYNATLAFMYGPLVLAGVDPRADTFVPRGSDFRDNPSVFIRRNSSHASLEFEATSSNGTKLRMMPLRNIMDESYVVYLMTAGTKPPQPAIKYCPASAGGNSGVSCA